MINRMLRRSISLKTKRLAVRLGVASLLCFSLTCFAADPGPAADSRNKETRTVAETNIDRVKTFLAEAAAKDGRLDDYDFALIGDIQNSVLNLRHDVFNAIAKDMVEAVDKQTGQRLYDRIRFVILLGDEVYEGPSRRQWDALARVFDGVNPDGTPCLYAGLLAKDKPIIPVLGNHEILSFRPQTQTRYKDLFDSPSGVANFKKFFGWDRLIADPHILYPVPADVPADLFQAVLAKLQDAPDRQVLTANFALKGDGRYHLKFYESPSLRQEEFKAAKNRLAAELAPIFRKAGYGTLPVLNSDNMICYAFEAGNVVYLFLDSMARGWHYPVFARLKQELYPAKKDRHRLNLFTISPYNGQSDFYAAVAAYARESGKSLVPMMHHSIFNSSRDIYSTGVEYNVWLALGLPQARGEDGDRTIFDDMVFSDVSWTFSACVHAYEHFALVAKRAGAPDHNLQWYVSGGGGGPLRTVFFPERMALVANLYNQKLKAESDAVGERSVETKDDQPRVGHHYLIVHVKDGRIVEVTPRFINPAELPKLRQPPQLTVAASYYSGPSSPGLSAEFSPGTWGLEKINGYLTFVKWRPTITLGMIDYNAWSRGPDVKAYAAGLEISPLSLECHIPKASTLTLHLPGFLIWDGRGDLRRYFLTMGMSAPLLYDLFGRFEQIDFGIKALIPFHAGSSANADFGARTNFVFSVGYRFRL